MSYRNWAIFHSFMATINFILYTHTQYFILLISTLIGVFAAVMNVIAFNYGEEDK